MMAFEPQDFEFTLDVEWELATLQLLCEELREIGAKAARVQAARGVPFAEACYESMPDGCRIRGPVWLEIEHGFRAEWERLQ